MMSPTVLRIVKTLAQAGRGTLATPAGRGLAKGKMGRSAKASMGRTVRGERTKEAIVRAKGPSRRSNRMNAARQKKLEAEAERLASKEALVARRRAEGPGQLVSRRAANVQRRTSRREAEEFLNPTPLAGRRTGRPQRPGPPVSRAEARARRQAENDRFAEAQAARTGRRPSQAETEAARMDFEDAVQGTGGPTRENIPGDAFRARRSRESVRERAEKIRAAGIRSRRPVTGRTQLAFENYPALASVSAAGTGLFGFDLLSGPVEGIYDRITGDDLREEIEAEGKRAFRDMASRAQLQRYAADSQANMLRLQRIMPHTYMELSAGRTLPQGAQLYGSPVRTDLLQAVAGDMATGDLTTLPSPMSELEQLMSLQ